jgi:hypothetical protein
MDIRIEIKNKKKKPEITAFSFPERWDEVPEPLYPKLASLYLAAPKVMDDYSKTVRAFTLLAWKEWNTLKKLEAEELYTLLHLVDWVFNRLDLSKNLIPAVTIKKLEYLGPADGLANLRFAEWCVADTHYISYSRYHQAECLHKLCAVLYRPAGNGDAYTPGHALYRGDRREKFNDQLIDTRAKLMAKLPQEVLQGVYLFFASCRFTIIRDHDQVFPPKSNKREDNYEPDYGWLGVYDDLRADPKYGGTEALEEEFLDTVLFSLQRSNIKMKKLKRDHDF